MARTKRRRTKHRGTKAGTIERRGRTGVGSKERARQDPKADARRRREERLNKPPTLRGAVNRAAFAAVIFAALVMLVFRESPAVALPVAVVMLLFYIPLSYFTDKVLYNRRQRRRTQARS